MADGTANIVYAVGDSQRQWQRHDATIVGNTLRVARATYELTGNDQLDATYEGDNGRSRATMSRIELAYLTRTGATIWQNRLTPPASATALPPWRFAVPPSPFVARAQQPACGIPRPSFAEPGCGSFSRVPSGPRGGRFCRGPE